MRLLNPLVGIKGSFAAGQSVIVDVPTGLQRYHGIKLVCSATVGGNPSTDPTAIIESVRVEMDSIPIRELTPAQILKWAALIGITASASELPLLFSNPKRPTLDGQEATSWTTKGQKNFQIKVKFAAGAVDPTLACIAEYDFARNVVSKNGVPEDFLAIEKTEVLTQAVPQGVFDFNTLPRRYPIQAIFLQAAAGTISAVQVKRDGEIVHELTPAQNALFLKDFGLDPTQFTYPIVFDFTRQLTDPLTGVRFEVNPSGIADLNVKITASQATTVTAIVVSRVPGYV